MLALGLDAARWTWRHPFRRRRVRLPARVVCIRGQEWHAVRDERGNWTCNPRQARHMRAALTPILAAYETPLENMIKLLLHDR